jgi:hypothetical protein
MPPRLGTAMKFHGVALVGGERWEFRGQCMTRRLPVGSGFREVGLWD